MGDENGQSTPQLPVEAPRGFLAARVDEKGRLKLPAAIVQYLEALGERKVFVTTLNGTTARIYPISAWRATESALEEPGEDIEAREDIAFIASHFGADDEMDAQGRVLVPTELRRKLKLENEQVFLRCFKGRIDVFGREVHQQRLSSALDGGPNKLQELEKKGLR